MNLLNKDILTAEKPIHIEYKCTLEKNKNHVLHKHDFIELICVTEGKLKIYADYQYYTLPPGNMIFINSNTPHSTLYEESNTKFYYVCFSPEIIYSYGKDFFNAMFFFWIKLAINNRVCLLNTDINSTEVSLIKDAYNAYIEEDFAFDYSLLSKVLLICVCFFEKNLTENKNYLQKITNSDSISIKKILNEIETGFSSFPVPEYATDYNYHSSLITKQFNDALGYSFSKYVDLCRIYEAMFILATTSKKVTDIAYSVGFTASSYFSKLFYLYTGFTPSAFRKNQRSLAPAEVDIKAKLSKAKNQPETNKRLFYNSIFLASYYDRNEGALAWTHSDYFDIIYADIGKINIDFENEHYVMSPGNILIICPNEKYRIKFIDVNERQILRIQFYPDILNIGMQKCSLSDKLYEYTKSKGRFFKLVEEDTDIMHSLVALYNERYKFEPSSEIFMRAHIINIVGWILNKQHSIFTDSEQKKDTKTSIILKEILNHIDAHYTEKLSLEEIANKYYISYSHLSREFKAITHTKFYSYINAKRLVKGRFLLATTNLSVNEIATTLGFCSSSRFIEKFTKRFDLSPREFRNRFKTKDTLREENRFLY